MKYKIIESPRVGKKPLFFIKAWGHKISDSIWSNKKTECWCYMDTRGNPINEGYRHSFLFDDYSGSFKSLDEAKRYLDKVIEYRKKKVKTVFEIET